MSSEDNSVLIDLQSVFEHFRSDDVLLLQAYLRSEQLTVIDTTCSKMRNYLLEEHI